MELLVVGARSSLDLTALCARFSFDKLYVFGGAIDAARAAAKGPGVEEHQGYLDEVERHLMGGGGGAPPPLPSVPAYLEQTVAVGADESGQEGPAQAVEFWGSRLVMFAPDIGALPDTDAELHNADLWVVGGGPPRLDDVRGRPVFSAGRFDEDGRLLRLTLARQGARALLVDEEGKVFDERTIMKRKKSARMVVR